MERNSDVSLSAQLTESATELRVRYTIKNSSAEDIFVLDGMRARGAGEGETVVDTSSYSLFPSGTGDATILVGIPPLPANKLVAVRIMPVATKLAPGASLSRELKPVPMPLTQRSPYVTPEELRTPETMTVQSLVLGVQFLRASVPSLVVTALPFSATHVAVKTAQTVQDAQEVQAVLQQKQMTLRVVPRPR